MLRYGPSCLKRKGWMSLTGQMPRPISVFWQAMHWKGVKLVSVVGVLPVYLIWKRWGSNLCSNPITNLLRLITRNGRRRAVSRFIRIRSRSWNKVFIRSCRWTTSWGRSRVRTRTNMWLLAPITIISALTRCWTVTGSITGPTIMLRVFQLSCRSLRRF